jgi:hypothetical protein
MLAETPTQFPFILSADIAKQVEKTPETFEAGGR